MPVNSYMPIRDVLQMNILKAFMRLATAAEQEQLAELAGTSRQYLYKLANEGEHWARSAGAGLAAKLEVASEQMRAESKGRLPKLLRTDLNQTCRECPYAKRCLGDRALAAHFQIVEQSAAAAPAPTTRGDR